MSRELEAAGFALTADSASDEPDGVLVGFDTELTYARLCRAAYWISKGKPFVATHPDRVCPTDQPTVLVDCGAICAALERSGGARAGRGVGQARSLHVAGHSEPARPGAGAARDGGRPFIHGHGHGAPGGALGVLVLTGETTAAQGANHSPAPDLVVSGLAEFGERLRAARQKKGS